MGYKSIFGGLFCVCIDCKLDSVRKSTPATINIAPMTYAIILLASLNLSLKPQTDTTVAGNDAIKFEFILGGSYHFEVFMIANGKLYTLSYNDKPLSVPETVKLANKAVETFQLTGLRVG